MNKSMTRAVDLAQPHVKDVLWPWQQAAFVATLLAATSCVAATDYPPPPGAYRSEPVTLPATPQIRLHTADTGERHKSPQTGTSSMRLLIPQLAPSHQPGEYDAANLFGSAKPTSQTKGTRSAATADQYSADRAAAGCGGGRGYAGFALIWAPDAAAPPGPSTLRAGGSGQLRLPAICPGPPCLRTVPQPGHVPTANGPGSPLSRLSKRLYVQR